MTKTEKYKKRLKILGKIYSNLWKVFLVLFVLILLFSNFLAKNVFYSENRISYTESVPYKQTIKVSTYLCYVTDYGSNYHDYGCQYLWNSAHVTTVYEAKRDGYTKCSKCTPTTPTSAYVEVEKKEDVTKYRYEKKPASALLVGLIASASLVVLFILIAVVIDKIIQSTNEKLEKESITNEIANSPPPNE